MLILLIFLAELAAAILAFIFREHVSVLSTHLNFSDVKETDILPVVTLTCALAGYFL